MAEKKSGVLDLPRYLFHQGTNYFAQKYLGVHFTATKAVARVWAPNAEQVYLCGDFNDWCQDGVPLKKITQQGIWEVRLSIDVFPVNTRYKFAIKNNEKIYLKSDPYAFFSETLSKTASIAIKPEKYNWLDANWQRYKKRTMKIDNEKKYPCPINIYEVHLGSWRTRDGKSTYDGDGYLNYREIADQLLPYVKKMGYTHIELMPISEYPFDGSWGYQVCSFFAPTSRFGNIDDFKYFVEKMHIGGVGVILDWVPAHFPKDEHGLYEFDGQPLYEYQTPNRMENCGWGTRYFDVGRNEVKSFLISNALFWIEEFHIDGLRIDAVSSMLYLDYDKNDGEWTPNIYGENKNLEAISFLRTLNETILTRHPYVMMIAEESTSWGGITAPPYNGGLGFNFKWNMGWANDMFDYMLTDPIFRKYNHTKLTFSMMYAFSENFILPVSHDEVVHGKLSLIDKMHGSYENKFKQIRLFLAYMIAHPGKKMLFMGCEYGQFREWDYNNQLEWFMLDYQTHKELLQYTASLNHFYLQNDELWEDDFSWNGFRWVETDEADLNLLAFERRNSKGSRLLCVFNFSGAEIKGYPLVLPKPPQKNGATKQKNTDKLVQNEVFSSYYQEENEQLEVINGQLWVDMPPFSAKFYRLCTENEITL